MMHADAILSACGLYRYRLTRRWGNDPPAAFIMLNPSTADGEVDDPTIRKCIGFAKRWGCGSLQVGNLFAFRATSPSDMRRAADPVGPYNRAYIEALVDGSPSKRIICAWGIHGKHMGQDRIVWEWIKLRGGKPQALFVTADGFPGHPLFIPYDRPPMEFNL